jgi:hypothetical protein
MGLLDDAIREHLDLKRRRGADPAEIERLEREALGPVRRGPEEVEPVELEAADLDYEGQIESDWRNGHDELPGADSYAPADEGDLLDPPAFDERHEADQATDRADLGEDARGSDADAVDPPAPRSGRPTPAQLDDETAEFDVANHLEQPPAEEGEDMLEETPDFLQDTPDHDRLWFEQRPPKDFDFDG